MSKGKRLTREELVKQLEENEYKITDLQFTISKLTNEVCETEISAKAQGYQEAIREVFTLIEKCFGRSEHE